jgi:hypothetical protein
MGGVALNLINIPVNAQVERIRYGFPYANNSLGDNAGDVGWRDWRLARFSDCAHLRCTIIR